VKACWNAPGIECAGFAPWTNNSGTRPAAISDVSAAMSPNVLVDPTPRSAPNFTNVPTEPAT